MYVVIQQRKETKIPKGSVCREIKQRDNSPSFYGVGEPIPREPKFKYDIRLKDKGVQHHICTVTYWDIVDGWACGTLCDSVESHLRLMLLKANGLTKAQKYSDDGKALWHEYQKTDEYSSMIWIGKPLISSPAFPPIYTVLEIFTSHGVPSKFNLYV